MLRVVLFVRNYQPETADGGRYDEVAGNLVCCWSVQNVYHLKSCIVALACCWDDVVIFVAVADRAVSLQEGEKK